MFGAVLAPMYGVMMADYYLVKRQQVKTAELYTMQPGGRFYYDGGWNKVGLAALLVSGAISVGWELSTQMLKLLPPNNLGWLIGAAAGALLYSGDADAQASVGAIEAITRPIIAATCARPAPIRAGRSSADSPGRAR